jgi:hypothetical protein
LLKKYGKEWEKKESKSFGFLCYLFWMEHILLTWKKLPTMSCNQQSGKCKVSFFHYPNVLKIFRGFTSHRENIKIINQIFYFLFWYLLSYCKLSQIGSSHSNLDVSKRFCRNKRRIFWERKRYLVVVFLGFCLVAIRWFSTLIISENNRTLLVMMPCYICFYDILWSFMVFYGFDLWGISNAPSE